MITDKEVTDAFNKLLIKHIEDATVEGFIFKDTLNFLQRLFKNNASIATAMAIANGKPPALHVAAAIDKGYSETKRYVISMATLIYCLESSRGLGDSKAFANKLLEAVSREEKIITDVIPLFLKGNNAEALVYIEKAMNVNK